MTKEERRLAMPLSTAFIDDMRETFGPLTAINASENGQNVLWGNPIEAEGVYVADPMAMPS